ncbi:MAG: pyridoxal phosphate-dependent aminotransferase [Verrucomicrobiota bacterium]|nr:pyridoxal phosphate-dependent aminotransferase [Verrucomicrobiota bacterium]
MNMENMLSPWAQNVSPSPTLAVDAKAKELKAAGEDVCGFGAGEPDFDTPSFIKEAGAKALADGKTKYAPAGGLPDLRAALAEQYNELGVLKDTNPAQVVVSPGGKYSCYLAILATCGPGDEVLIPAPYWVSYPEMAKLAGATPKFIFAGDDKGFKVSADQIEGSLTPQTKLVILNSPSNPTGCLYSREEMEEIVELACKKDFLLMSDEIYEYLLYDGVEHHRPASFGEDAANRVITVSGFSKTFSMTGWRLGTLVANPIIAKAVASLQSQTTSNATTFAQYGALAAIKNWDQSVSAVSEMLVHFDRRRLKLLEGLQEINGVRCLRAQGAFYLFPNISSFGLSSEEFSARLLEEEKVAVVSGHAFGADGYVRLSYATSDEVIEKGLERMRFFCKRIS